jgi:hypothetical protein
MFGSLVVVFPTPHEGGALLLRHRGQEWTFDSAAVLSVASPPSIAYAAFFSDIEHEVLPVTSGHRVTLTYNLYFDGDEHTSAKKLVLEPSSESELQEANKEKFSLAFEALLGHPEFLSKGGTLGFGLRHVYQVEDKLEHVYSLLKGSDAALYQSLRALGFEPVLYLFYDSGKEWCRGHSRAVLIDRVPNFEEAGEIEDPTGELCSLGGLKISRLKQVVTWVTPPTTFNRRESAYMAHGNEPILGLMYGDVCLVVRIGKVGERLGYETVAEVRKKWERERERERQ